MTRTAIQTLSLVLFASCTALSQKDAYLDSLPRAVPPVVPVVSNVVFTEDFENGLGNWNQINGSWTTGTPAANGVSLVSPASASPATFNLTTVNDIDLRSRSNCELKYDASFNLSGAAGVFAQVLYAGSVVGEFKNTTSSGAISSSTQFLTRRVILNAGTSGKLTILTGVATSTTADLKIDNISVTCANSFSWTASIVTESFESGGSNWALGAWAITAGVGQGGSSAANRLCVNTCSATASYVSSINLQGRSGCSLSYFYDLTGSSGGAQDCLTVYLNGLHHRTHCSNSTLTAVISQYVTAFEGISSNTLSFTCSASTGNQANCTIDNVSVNCQQ